MSITAPFARLLTPDLVPTAWEHDDLPALHDPSARQLLGQTGPWEIRGLTEGDPGFEDAAARGWLHLQLWYPLRGLSVLTPSLLTRVRFQSADTAGAVHEWDSVEDLAWDLPRVLDAPLPNLCLVRSLNRWMVDRPEAEVRERLLAAGDPRVIPH